jgi:hypothetical protein
VEGRVGSGFGVVERVEFSSDGGGSWDDAELGKPLGRYGWRSWSYEWEAQEPGEYELCTLATDAVGNIQPWTATRPGTSAATASLWYSEYPWWSDSNRSPSGEFPRRLALSATR